jgi:hypothetical protein
MPPLGLDPSSEIDRLPLFPKTAQWYSKAFYFILGLNRSLNVDYICLDSNLTRFDPSGAKTN